MTRLDVNSGETYAIPGGVTEAYTGATIDGTLDVDGELLLTDDAQAIDVKPDDRTDLPMGIDLPLRGFKLEDMNMGIAVFLVGILGLTGGLSAVLRNYAAGGMWAIAVVALLLAGMFNVGLELFWIIIMAVVLLLGAGMVLRWSGA